MDELTGNDTQQIIDTFETARRVKAEKKTSVAAGAAVEEETDADLDQVQLQREL